jgi:Tfp pilus assembly protein PilZ
VDQTSRSGYTQNISESGLFVRTNRVFRPGTTVHLEIQFPDRSFHLWGRVAWAKKVPPQLAHLVNCGMGVRYLAPTVEYLEHFEKWCRS